MVGTHALRPAGGSWLVKVTDDPSSGWRPVRGSWRPGDYAGGGQSQISGYRAEDGYVYIVADSFDRTRPVTLYRTEPARFTNRSAWQPYVRFADGGLGWGTPRQAAVGLSATNFGELSFRQVDGAAVLAGFNVRSGPDGAVEIWVADHPTEIFRRGRRTVLMQQSDPHGPNFVPQNYGGYILPGSSLDRMKIFASQWNTLTDERGVPLGAPYNTQPGRRQRAPLQEFTAVSARAAGPNMVCLMAPSVPRSLCPSGRSSSVAAAVTSSAPAAASTIPISAASVPPNRRPVVIEATAAPGVSLAWMIAAMPGVKGILMSTSGKQK